MSTFTICTSSECFQTPVQMVLPKCSADVWDQGHFFFFFWQAFLPLLLLKLACEILHSYLSDWLARGSLWTGRPGRLRPYRLGTSSIETDKEIRLRFSASHLSLKSAVRSGSAGSQIWPGCHNWPQLGSCCSSPIAGATIVKCKQKLGGAGKGLGIETRGSCVPHLSTLIPHGKSHNGKGRRWGGVSPLFLVVSRCSFGD